LALGALPIGKPSSAFPDTFAEPKASSRIVSFMQKSKQERLMSREYLVAALFGIALISAPALAQTTTEMSDAITTISQGGASQWRSSKLIGMNVFNNSNEKIANISDLLVDQNGKIQGVILGVGEYLGMRKHLVTVKFENLKWVTTSGSASAPNPGGTTYTTYPDHAVLNATKDQLKSMPEFSATAEN
jgi:sporulation protein YlmC with PRC-barrel domain